MNGREWQPGDVAMVTWVDSYDGSTDKTVRIRVGQGETDVIPAADRRDAWWGPSGYLTDDCVTDARPLVVIDPEDREQVERLASVLHAHGWRPSEAISLTPARAALREFANPTPPRPEEPTDPQARVTDRRDNIWRLLADGDWVCTSGPDIGEYIDWSRLADERGPLSVEVCS